MAQWFWQELLAGAASSQFVNVCTSGWLTGGAGGLGAAGRADRGWTNDQFFHWLGDTLTRLLLPA